MKSVLILVVSASIATSIATFFASVAASSWRVESAIERFEESKDELLQEMDVLLRVMQGRPVASVAGDVTINRGVDYEPLIRAQLERNNERMLQSAGTH